MTPKEKAQELLSKFVSINLVQVNDLVDGIRISLARESALIAVDEIIKAIGFDWMEVQNLDREYIYWNEVKKILDE